MNKFKLSTLTLCLALLAGCASTSQPPQPSEPLQVDAADAFLVDFDAGTVIPLGSAGDLETQTFYRPKKGVAFKVSVIDRVLGAPGLYSVRVAITNKTGQTILWQSIDRAQLIATNFKTRNASGNVIPGGTITNTAGYKAESGYPFVVVPQNIAPGATRSVILEVSLPKGATRATFGLRLLATSAGSNNIPGPASGWVTALVGKYGQPGNVGGPAHLARLDFPIALAACDFWLYIAEQFNGVIKLYRDNVLSDHTSRGLGTVFGMGCLVGSGLPDRLVVADLNNQIKFLHLSGGVAETVGSGTVGFTDGNAATAQFNRPVDVAVLGQSVFVADHNNQAIRRLDRVAGNWVVSTVVFGLPGRPFAITSDGVGNLYFALYDDAGANSGVYRLPLDSSTTTRIYSSSGLDFNGSSLRWDGGGGLILGLYFNDALYRLTPTSDPDTWQGVKLAGTGFGSVGGGMRAKDAPVLQPAGLAVDRSGTVYVSSYNGHQVLKIDLRR